MENNKLQKILKDSHHEILMDEDDINNAEEENDYDNDEGEDDDDDDENTDNNKDDYDEYEKKADISKKIIDHGIRVQEIDLSKETTDRFLLGE